ncbi:polyphenol oxidase, chloroplastic-like [Magnolia sinica]|uniref:polyphenol oxidase, chloroplastic-like n=1 Tax=Magnolia sinica TaxID=86752 RepID=UPI00265A2FED|nr:polyphenol oxidase, chloroplastic-like [Magnolia sinica]
MASLSFIATTISSSSPLHRHHPRKALPSTTTRRFHTSCEQVANTTDTNVSDDNSSSILRMDRRNILLGGLGGGLYGAASLGLLGGGEPLAAIGAPITIPDLTKCHNATADNVGEVQCCPPYTDISTAIDFTPPSSKPLRVRKPAHLLSKDEVAKYKEAYRLMKALPEDDPRSFMQQANVHCQYCNGAYYQAGTTDTVLQVHYSWFFLPWHRLYLHFHERILGSLIGDDSFALPFWNWDSGLEGMKIPSVFTEDTSSPVYNEKRNLSHYPPAIIDFEYAWGDSPPSTDEEVKALIQKNLLQISKAYSESLTSPELFMGGVLRAGGTLNSPGSLETIHNGAHLWVGPDEAPHMDMGNFYSAGRDAMFYCHHSNVDRMWSIYRAMRGNKIEFDDSDWLDSTFVFVDENKQLVKCKVSDSLSTLQLRYIFEDVRHPWTDKGVRKKVLKAKKKSTSLDLVRCTEFGSTSKSLTNTIRVLASRPKKSRTKSEKEEAVEVLVVSGIQAPMNGPSRFDVYVSKLYGDDLAGPDLGELAGYFLELPHHLPSKGGETKTHTFDLKLGITNLLEDIDCEAAEKVVISLVPRFGEITVGGVGIQHLNTDTSSD